MSRVTLHRIEKGEPSVAAGAWANAMAALGMSLVALNVEDAHATRPEDVNGPDLANWISRACAPGGLPAAQGTGLAGARQRSAHAH